METCLTVVLFDFVEKWIFSLLWLILFWKGDYFEDDAGVYSGGGGELPSV